jgi:hypothetical protein
MGNIIVNSSLGAMVSHVIQVTDQRGGMRQNALGPRDKTDSRERHMSHLSNVVNGRPMLRAATSVILAFSFATPLVWLFSNLVVYGLRSFP